MNTFAAIVGWGLILAAVLGAIVPGLNCHLYFGGDKEGIDYHRDAADRIEKRLEAAAGAKAKEQP